MKQAKRGFPDSPMDYNPKTQEIEVCQSDSLLCLYLSYIDRIRSLIGIEYAPNTLRRYQSSLNSLKRFLGDGDIKVSELTHVFASKYYYYLVTKENLQPNSAYKNIKALHRVLNYAADNNIIPANPCKRFKCKYRNPNRPYLTNEELERIQTVFFKQNYLTRVQDLFIFQCYTGLSYSDMERLTTKNIEIGVDGKKWIVIHRIKTGERVALPILPKALAILKKYRYSLPVISNQKMNSYLKKIAKDCKINKRLSTHCGRHTFATTVTLGNGIPIETVSKVLGHTNISTTQIYAKIVDSKIAKDFSALMG